jgi:predicted HicB family RNase H-like nuclease
MTVTLELTEEEEASLKAEGEHARERPRRHRRNNSGRSVRIYEMTINLEVSEQTEARLTAAARRRGIDVSTLIEAMAVDYLPAVDSDADDGKTLYERFKEVIGTVDGLPTDLSQNQAKYMNGFWNLNDHRPDRRAH